MSPGERGEVEMAEGLRVADNPEVLFHGGHRVSVSTEASNAPEALRCAQAARRVHKGLGS